MPKITFNSLQTVAEQSAFEFGSRVRQLRLGEVTENLLAQKYAFTHQFSLRSSSPDGYDRLRDAFLAGANIV